MERESNATALRYIVKLSSLPAGLFNVNETSPARRSLPAEIGTTVGGWVVGQLKVAAIVTVLYLAGFAIARVPWWPLVALACGALQLVPIVGPTIGLLIAEAVAYFGAPNTYVWVWVLAAFVVIQALESFVLTPRILGRKLQLHPLAVFAAAIVGGIAFGPFGVVFAAPLLAIALVLWRRRSTRATP